MNHENVDSRRMDLHRRIIKLDGVAWADAKIMAFVLES